MARHLHINTELKEKARVQKYGDNEHTQRLKQV